LSGPGADATSACTAWRIEPLGDRALIIEFGSHVDPGVSARVRAVAQELVRRPPAGVTDVVPAFTTLALHYRPEAFRGEAPYEALRRGVEAILAQGVAPQGAAARVVEIPVHYGGESGPDLEEVAGLCRLAVDEVVARHAASPHVVHMLGFAPGLPYLAGLDPRLAVPRRATPRTAVPPGSVAIARDQTVIYPVQIPGGWSLIGRTPLRLFDPAALPPCLLQPGDRVRFVPIAAETLRAMEDRK
jgi:inhibitor of KinA